PQQQMPPRMHSQPLPVMQPWQQQPPQQQMPPRMHSQPLPVMQSWQQQPPQQQMPPQLQRRHSQPTLISHFQPFDAPLAPLSPPLQAPKFGDLKPMLDKYVGEDVAADWAAELPTPVFGSKVKYLDEAERQRYRVTIHNGKMYDSRGQPFDTSSGATAFGGGAQGRAMFVMDHCGNIFASNYQAVGKFHHTSFLAGQPVAAAGEIEVRDGEIKFVNRRSGHYQPTASQLNQVLHQLHESGVSMNGVGIGDIE
ncbi:MAG: hypothetical protein WD057_13680, partial [Aquisalimonadaceae bacterium]